MAKPQVYTWAVAAEAAVCALQSRTGAGSLLLNGTLSTPTNPLVIDFGNVSRVVTLTSTNNLSGVNVTITGTLNGRAQTETRAGPNNNTVATTAVFSTVTSVTTSNTVTAISLGTGTTGYSDWFTVDPYIGVMNLGIQVIATATVSYSFQVTLDDVQTNASPTLFTPVTALTTATTSQLGAYTTPVAYCRIAMISSDATGAFVATILQQGLTN